MTAPTKTTTLPRLTGEATRDLLRSDSRLWWAADLLSHIPQHRPDTYNSERLTFTVEAPFECRCWEECDCHDRAHTVRTDYGDEVDDEAAEKCAYDGYCDYDCTCCDGHGMLEATFGYYSDSYRVGYSDYGSWVSLDPEDLTTWVDRGLVTVSSNSVYGPSAGRWLADSAAELLVLGIEDEEFGDHIEEAYYQGFSDALHPAGQKRLAELARGLSDIKAVTYWTFVLEDGMEFKKALETVNALY